MQGGTVAPFLTASRQVSETGIFPDTPLEATRSMTTSLLGTIEVARALARSGHRLDLTGLDSQVGLLCAKTLDLPSREGREVLHELIGLRSALISLAEVIGLPPQG